MGSPAEGGVVCRETESGKGWGQIGRVGRGWRRKAEALRGKRGDPGS